MRWFVRGDVDGFFGLALDNLVQLLLIDSLCRHVLGFPAELLYGRVLPGVAVSLVIGNVFYAVQAMLLSRREGRTDVCALPYGINTVSLFAYVFLVMLPAKLAAEQAGVADPARAAWLAGLVACAGSGLIELAGAFFAERIRRSSPRAALLSTLSGIALGFISLSFLFQTFAHPLIGLATLAIVLLTYFGDVRFRGGLPGGLVAVAVGTGLAWMLKAFDAGPLAGLLAIEGAGYGLSLPRLAGAELSEALQGHVLWNAFSIILPMGLFNVIGSLQNIESSEAAGDRFPAGPSLGANGVGTLFAALFGSCFPTTIYIGHPGWKAMGARAGYSLLNAGFMTLVCLTGTLAAIAHYVPIEAGMAIVLWIGIVITAQAFQATDRAHAPAAVIGVMVGVGAWGTLMAKAGLRAAGLGAPGGPDFSADLIPGFLQQQIFIDGAFALEQGFIFTAMILAASTVAVIERQFHKAAVWCLIGALLSATGLMHSYRFTPADAVFELAPAWRWAAGYALMGAVFLGARWTTRPAPRPS